MDDLARLDVHEREEDVVHSFFTHVVVDRRTQGLRVVLVDAFHSGQERDEQLGVVLGELRDEARDRHITRHEVISIVGQLSDPFALNDQRLELGEGFGDASVVDVVPEFLPALVVAHLEHRPARGVEAALADDDPAVDGDRFVPLDVDARLGRECPVELDEDVLLRGRRVDHTRLCRLPCWKHVGHY